MNIHWKDWCWSWNSNTLATLCKELTHLKRFQFWERLRAGGEGDDRGWDGWMASPTQWTWVWVGSGSWWWTGKPGVLQSMGSQRVRHNWVTELTDTFTTFLHVFSWLSSFFFRLNNIPFSGCIKVYLFIYILKDILATSKFWPLWMKLLEKVFVQVFMLT